MRHPEHMPRNCKAFCEVCDHGVYNMEKHVQTEEYKRNVRRDTLRGHLNGGGSIISPRQGARDHRGVPSRKV